MDKVLALLVVALWAILFLSEQKSYQAWSWMIIASAVFAMTATGFVFLGFFHVRQGKRWPFFIVAVFPLFLSVAFMFVGHEEREDSLRQDRANRELQEKNRSVSSWEGVAVLLLSRKLKNGW